MKLIVQRVSSAKVSVKGKSVGKIDKGFFVLVGVRKKDSLKSAEILAEKLSKLRIMSDEAGKMNLTLGQVKGKLLVVSQFTLYAETKGGNRPSFIDAAEPKLAQEVYEHFLAELKRREINFETGKFGAYMEIETILDGPVTTILEA